MGFKKIILSLFLTSTTAYANQELIKEFDTSKNIAQTLNNPSSSAAQIDAFDQRGTNHKNSHTSHPNIKKHTEYIAKKLDNKTKYTKEKTNVNEHTHPAAPALQNTETTPKTNTPVPQNITTTTTQTMPQAKIPNFSTEYPAPMPLTSEQVPQNIRTTAEGLLGSNVTWIQKQCQYNAKITGGYKNQSNSITLSFTESNPHYQNVIKLGMESSSANNFSSGNTFVKINAEKLKQLAQEISSPTAQGEFKKLFSDPSNNTNFLPPTDFSSTPEPKEVDASEVPQNVKSVGEELLGQNIVWIFNNCQYVAKITGKNGDYTNAIKVPLYPRNPVYQGFLVDVIKKQGFNTNESENQNYTSKEKLKSLAQGISSPQNQDELTKLSKTNTTF